MIDSATINEAVDLLECAGWKGYAQAVRDQAAALVAEKQVSQEHWNYYETANEQRGELLAVLKGVVRVADRKTAEFAAARAAIAKAECIHAKPPKSPSR
jgi:hypothetical protein